MNWVSQGKNKACIIDHDNNTSRVNNKEGRESACRTPYVAVYKRDVDMACHKKTKPHRKNFHISSIDKMYMMAIPHHELMY
jgi:hypothetical protein